uniref:IS66 family transposase n=1 Tax=Aliiroseovarius halocynthiae TaxID=985055 RepID=UPI001FE8FDE3|nr:IS66 family transposase [Aliiroseovarius halocynthiae]
MARIPGKSELAKAIRNALTRMKKLRPYLDHGILDIDNNTAQKAMRPIAIGRKNYFFVAPKAAKKPLPLHIP